MEYPDNEHLKQQATLIHNAQITTIHSFCLSVIRDHFMRLILIRDSELVKKAN